MSNGQDGTRIKSPALGTYRFGTLTGAVYSQSKKYKTSELKLIGNFEGEGQGHWYAPWKAVVAMTRVGILQQIPGDGKKFAVTGQRFSIYRVPIQTDTGQTAHEWTAVAVDPAGNTINAGSFPDPFEPQDSDAPQATPAQPQPTAPTQQPEQQIAPPPGSSAPADPNPPTNGETKAQRAQRLAAEVDTFYGLSYAIAAYRQAQALGRPSSQINEEALQAGAASVMICLERLGFIPSGDSLRASLLDRLHELDAKLAGRAPSMACPQCGTTTEPTPVSTIPGATKEKQPEPVGAGAGDDEEDDLPF